MEIFLKHIAFALFTSFLIISIIYRELPWPQGGFGKRYTGSRAVLVTLGILFLWIFVVIPITSMQTEDFDYSLLMYGLLPGAPLGWLAHRGLSRLQKKFSYVTDVGPLKNKSQNKSQKMSVRRFLFWLIPGITVGVVAGVIISSADAPILISVVTSVLVSGVVAWLLARAQWN